MQKWSPEEFTSGPSVAALEPATPRWETLPAASAPTTPGHLFRQESRFADPSTLMANMTQAERAMIFELVEQDVAREYELREVELKTRQAEELAAARADYEDRLRRWSGEFGACLAAYTQESLHGIGQAAANLAVQLAAKLTRALVPLDPEILARALQTALYKVPSGGRLTVRLHPEDADWLRSSGGLLEQMGIDAIETDRRIERGGCIVNSGGGEWDATLAGQLESLGEIVQEAIATAGQGPREILEVPPPAAAADTELEPAGGDELD